MSLGDGGNRGLAAHGNALEHGLLLANGHYSTAPSYTPVPEQGPATGKNFAINSAVTLNL